MSKPAVKTKTAWHKYVVGCMSMMLLLMVIFPSGIYAAPSVRGLGPEGGETIIISSIAYLPLIVRYYPPIPHAPTLAPITEVSTGQPYTVTWSVSATTPILYYTLQASDDSAFSSPRSYTTTETSYTIPAAANQLTYYRVRGHNVWGDGAWSNVEVTQFAAFRDHFDGQLNVDWHAKRTSSPKLSSMTIGYDGNGNLETMVGDMYDFAIFSPLVPAPPPPYHIQIRTQIIHRVNEVSYGLAFGGNEGSFCMVDRSRAQDPAGCFSHYYRLNVIWAGGYLKYSVARIDGHDERGRGLGATLRGFSNVLTGGPDDWHVWDIWVYDDRFGVGVDGQFIAWINDTTYLHDPYFGIFSSTFEYNYAHFRHARYYVEPITPDMNVPPPPQ